MKDQNKNKKAKSSKSFKRTFEVNFEAPGVVAQDNMSDKDNPYNHLTKSGGKKQVDHVGSGDYQVMLRGRDNHAPQKDIELGLKSMSHKSISDKMATLVAGSGIEFRIKKPENENELNPTEQAFINEAEEFSEKGLNKYLQRIANGIVYQGISSVVVTQDRASFSSTKEAVYPVPVKFVAQRSERLRYSMPKVNEFGEEIVPYHFYHNDWGFTGDCKKSRRKPKIPTIVKIEKYISDSKKEISKDAFAVDSNELETSKSKKYVSFEIRMKESTFDNTYPLPKWKSNSSINDIQNEFEASCIRTDYLRNGLHIFAVVNVYSMKWNVDTDDGSDDMPNEEWAEQLDIVKSLKRSHNSGRILVNALSTSDSEKDGKIEINKIDLEFPVAAYKGLMEESRAGILTAWGVQSDLFGISKPEGNNLRSQSEFLKIGIMMLKEDVALYQDAIKKGIDKILNYYGLDNVESFIKPHNSSLFLVVMSEIAKEFMKVNEVREKILSLPPMNEDELVNYIDEKMKIGSKSSSSNNQNQEDEQ